MGNFRRILAMSLTLATAATAGAALAADPFSLYGDGMRFDVLRDGQPVGFHTVSFAREGDGLAVRSRFEVQVDVLFITAYRFEYRSEERWRDRQLEALTAGVNDDGERFELAASRDGDSFRIERGGEVASAAAPLFPTTHWNAAVLDQTQVLNTLTGQVNQVGIEPRGRERVETGQGPVEATRYDYTGELRTSVWYDDAGRWVKLRFEGRDGSTIEYVCRLCLGGPARTAARR